MKERSASTLSRSVRPLRGLRDEPCSAVRVRHLCPSVFLLSLSLCSTAVSAQEYVFRSFEVVGAPITGGRGLNDGGCVAGYSQSDPEDFLTAQAILRCEGDIETIDPPTAIGDSRAFDVNQAGLIVGSAQRPAGNDGWQFDGVVHDWVEYPGAEQTVLRGVNDAGDVVGEFVDVMANRHGFVRLGGVFSPVDVPLAIETRARGLNNVGDVVGFWSDGSGVRHAFTRDDAGVITTFDYPGATETLLGEINDAGEMVGTWIDGDGRSHGFLITAPLVQFISFDVPGATDTLATGINESGEMTGEWVDEGGTRRGFIALPTDLFGDDFESGSTGQWSSVSE